MKTSKRRKARQIKITANFLDKKLRFKILRALHIGMRLRIKIFESASKIPVHVVFRFVMCIKTGIIINKKVPFVTKL
jgi:hypothetical protein